MLGIYLSSLYRKLRRKHDSRTSRKGVCPNASSASNKPTFSKPLTSSSCWRFEGVVSRDCGLDSIGMDPEEEHIAENFKKFQVAIEYSFYRLVSKNQNSWCNQGMVFKL